MRKLKTDLTIFDKFNFEKLPVGVRLLLNKPEGINPLPQDRTLPLCQMAREAQERGEPFYFTKENEDCFGKMALGMEGMAPFAEAGLVGEKFEIYNDARANKRFYDHLPTLTAGTVNYAVLAPLDKLTFEPDLLILMATPSQAEIVMRAMSYSTGEIWESKKTGVLGCCWLYAYPYKTGKVNYFVTGMTFGEKAKEINPEGWILISIPWDWIPIIIQNLKEMKWVLPSYSEGREKFYQRKARVLEECIKETQNP